MKKTAKMLGMILLFLVLLDMGVAAILRQAEMRGKMDSLVRYFDYGRSVPGKLAQWEARPNMPGNLSEVAWRSENLAISAAAFAKEPPETGPVIRSYGMSFVARILRKAQEQNPGLKWDGHAGPGAPPNFTYAMFQEDRANRRKGDIVVLGILSSAVPAMAALSNRTIAFEQPAPFTYPIFRLDGEGLKRVEPLVNSADEQRALENDPEARRKLTNQFATEDAFYSPITFGWTWLDSSPFARLVRRTWAMGHIAQVKNRILAGDEYPYAEVLERMIVDFARTAREDGQIPVVMAIQTRDALNVDIAALTVPILKREKIAYLATAELFDPKDPSGFLSDGHYKPEIDARFSVAFTKLLSKP
ncbi:MAG: hypothetical protein ACK5II_08985 [Paracoccus sp. (in: a-proteobacteria)]